MRGQLTLSPAQLSPAQPSSAQPIIPSWACCLPADHRCHSRCARARAPVCLAPCLPAHLPAFMRALKFEVYILGAKPGGGTAATQPAHPPPSARRECVAHAAPTPLSRGLAHGVWVTVKRRVPTLVRRRLAAVVVLVQHQPCLPAALPPCPLSTWFQPNRQLDRHDTTLSLSLARALACPPQTTTRRAAPRRATRPLPPPIPHNLCS